MPDRLPPLTALRAFDAAARHMSFQAAAKELSVTPAALSYQIKSLEAHLGAPVFRRLNRAVELTDLGQTLRPGISDAFQQLQQTWTHARRQLDETHLTVTAGPAFTSEWLAPRMFSFALAHPEIELRFSASLKRLDLDRDGIDVAIRFGVPDGDEGAPDILFRDWLTPMMTPELAKTVSRPEDLLKLPLIIDDSLDFLDTNPGWVAWFANQGIEIDPPHGTHFNLANHAVDFAVAGGGAMMGRVSISDRKLRDGRLVAPFRKGITTNASFRFICAKGTETRPHIAAFRDWLKAEMSALETLREGFEITQI